jgi:hypothetical protein
VIDPVFKYLLLRFKDDEKCLVHQNGSFSRVIPSAPTNNNDYDRDDSFSPEETADIPDIIILDSDEEYERPSKARKLNQGEGFFSGFRVGGSMYEDRGDEVILLDD